MFLSVKLVYNWIYYIFYADFNYIVYDKGGSVFFEQNEPKWTNWT